MKVWVLADDRAGNVNQLLGVAEALHQPFERKEIRYNRWVKLPNWLRGRTFIGLDSSYKQDLVSDFPDVVLSAGRRSFPIARAIKRLSKGKTKIVQLMNPLNGQKDADLIVFPLHDNYTGHASNVLQVLGTPHRITSEKLAQEKLHWKNVMKQYPPKRLSLIVGGATKNKPFTLEMARSLIQGVKDLKPASVLVTTSRRTPEDIVAVLQKELPRPCFFYRFGDKTENPYFGLLSWADEIIVTGDSMSMCTECCATGVPVFIFAPEGMVSEKHQRFHKNLYAQGVAAPVGQAFPSGGQRINPADEIADRILQLCPMSSHQKK